MADHETRPQTHAEPKQHSQALHLAICIAGDAPPSRGCAVAARQRCRVLRGPREACRGRLPVAAQLGQLDKDGDCRQGRGSGPQGPTWVCAVGFARSPARRATGPGARDHLLWRWATRQITGLRCRRALHALKITAMSKRRAFAPREPWGEAGANSPSSAAGCASAPARAMVASRNARHSAAPLILLPGSGQRMAKTLKSCSPLLLQDPFRASR